MFKKIFYLLLFLIIIIPFNTNAKEVTLHLFYRDGCQHCAKEKEYLETIKKDYPNLKVEKYEIWSNLDNSNLMEKTSSALKEEINYVPYTVIGSYSTVGFNENTKELIKKYYDICIKNDCVDVVSKLKANKDILEIQNEIKEFNDNINNVSDITVILPFIGKTDIKKLNTPLLLIAIAIGLTDGFNPCAMWVLIFLISMLLNMKDRKRMWIIGITFLATSALIYLLFMASWLKITLSIKEIKLVNYFIAMIALIGGIINVNSYIKTKKEATGCHVTNNEKRKSIISRIKKLTSEKSLLLALIGVIILAISVNFVELLCSAGLPVIFTRILSVNNLSTISYVFYMLVYILCYLFDDIIIFTIAMITFKITGITNKYNKYSHLIGGIIMLLVGILLIFKPEWLMFGI